MATPKSTSTRRPLSRSSSGRERAVDGAGRHGAPVDDRNEAAALPDLPRNLDCDPLDVLEVHGPVAARGRTDAHEHDVRLGQRVRERCRDAETGRRARRCDELVEPRLDHRAPPLVQLLDLGAVDVDADHVVPEFREARGRDGADVAEAHDNGPHVSSGPERAYMGCWSTRVAEVSARSPLFGASVAFGAAAISARTGGHRGRGTSD